MPKKPLSMSLRSAFFFCSKTHDTISGRSVAVWPRKRLEDFWSLGISSHSKEDVMIDLIVSRCSTHGLLLYFTLLYISNGSVSTSLVGHVLYSVDLMSAICSPHYYLMVHRYIYSRYSSVFLTLYQLYHSLSFSTLNLSSSLYLSVATWVTP